jgi:hypothetical protein
LPKSLPTEGIIQSLSCDNSISNSHSVTNSDGAML